MTNTETKVAVVTGASQGIGAALVQGFRSRNYRVIALSRSIKPSGDPNVVTVQGDVADPKTADAVFKEAFDRFGRIAAWTGQNCVEWCGSIAAEGISVAGNMLAGEPTVAATFAAWQSSPDLPVPERLMAAKYWHGGELAHDGRHAWLRITPGKITSWDFRKLAALPGRD